MKTGTFTLFVTLGLVALLTFFFIQAQVLELKDEEQRISNAIVNFQELNTRINHQIDQSRFGVLQNYDSINSDLHKLETTLLAITRDSSDHISNEVEKKEIDLLLEKLAQYYTDKHDAIEKFKSYNAVLKNSLAFFTKEAREVSDILLTAQLSSSKQRDEVGQLLHGIVQSVIILNRSPIPAVLEQLQRSTDQLSATITTLPTPLRQRFDDLIRHTNIISNYTVRVSGMVEKIFSIPLDYTSRLLDAEHHEFFSFLLSRSNVYRTYLFGFSLVLLGSIIFLFAQLQLGAKKLSTLNANLAQEVHVRESAERRLRKYQEDLEETVNTRTHDLEAANEKLSHEVEEQIKSQRRLELLTRAIEAASEGIIVSAGPYPNLGILYANPAFTELTGYSFSEVHKKNCSFLQGPDTDTDVIEAIRDAIRNGNPVRKTILNYRKDGVPFWNDLTINPIKDDHGKVTNFVGIQNDITPLKQIHERLFQAKIDAEQANRAKSDFLAAMSHEIRTPMNVIVGMSDLLETAPLTGEQHGYLKTMRRAGDNLLKLINDILDLSKIESGKLELESAPFNLHDMLTQTCNLIEVKALEKRLKLSMKIAPDVPQQVLGDAVRLRQILINLLGNALKFTENGSIRVAASKVEDQKNKVIIKFSVADTGIGIDEKQRKQIFLAFTQADTSVTRKHGGTGLGLSICQRLAELHGGTIDVQSKLGKGSVFSFTAKLEVLHDLEEIAKLDAISKTAEPSQIETEPTLPAPEPARVSATPSAVQDSENTDEDKKEDQVALLLVEDNMDNMMLIKAFLKKSKYNMVHADNGKKGFEQVKTGKFDLVLMDMQMPIMDGYTATSEIRKLEQAESRPRIPIIAFTAHALVGDKEKCMIAGCDDHLTKPVKKKVLLEMLEKHSPKETVTA
jgi:PAS domain S-box-containing protein